jgi:hypothetical protein
MKSLRVPTWEVANLFKVPLFGYSGPRGRRRDAK